MAQNRVVIIVGSGGDEEFTRPLRSTLKKLGVPCEFRVASAHKTPQKLLAMLGEYERSNDNIVYVTVAGRSNALSGFVDANTRYPVIACPPASDKFGGADIYSSLRMPSGVAPLVVLEPEGAALAAAKILALSSAELQGSVLGYQRGVREKVESDDETLSKME